MDGILTFVQTYRTFIFVAVGLVAFYLLLLKPAASTKFPLKTTLAKDAWKSVDVVKELGAKTGRSYAVVGASGFVGRCLVEYLLLRGEGTPESPILCLDVIKQSPFIAEPYFLHNKTDQLVDTTRVKYIQCDIRSRDSVRAALSPSSGSNGNSATATVDTVFLVAALLTYAQRLDYQREFSMSVNVGGAENIIACCIELGIPTLVYTSTAHVALRCQPHEHKNLNEANAPLVTEETMVSWYGVSKAMAETKALSANGATLQGKQPRKDGATKLQTISVRPTSAVVGLGDHYGLQRLLDLDGPRRHDLFADSDNSWINQVSVESIVYAELCAEKALLDKQKQSAVAGQAFFVGGTVMNMEQLYGLARDYYVDMYQGAVPEGGNPPTVGMAPSGMIWVIAYVVECLLFLTNGRIASRLGEMAMLTPTTVMYTNMSYSYDDSKARTLLGYKEMYEAEMCAQKTAYLYAARNKAKLAAKSSKKTA